MQTLPLQQGAVLPMQLPFSGTQPPQRPFVQERPLQQSLLAPQVSPAAAQAQAPLVQLPLQQSPLSAQE